MEPYIFEIGVGVIGTLCAAIGHDFEFQAVATAEEQLPSTYTIERPTATITVTV